MLGGTFLPIRALFQSGKQRVSADIVAGHHRRRRESLLFGNNSFAACPAWTRLIVAAGASLVLASISWRVVERPANELKRHANAGQTSAN